MHFLLTLFALAVLSFSYPSAGTVYTFPTSNISTDLISDDDPDTDGEDDPETDPQPA